MEALIPYLPWILLPLAAWAQKAATRRASVAKSCLALVAGLALADACALALHPALGLGVGLAILAYELRNPLVPQLGTMGLWWLDPLLGVPGLFLAFWGAYQAQTWQAWPFALFAAYQMVGVSLGVVMAMKTLKRSRDGYAVSPGRPAPEFTLNDEQGFPLSLSSFKERSHVLLIFVRGDWCPSCHITLRTYARNKDRFSGKGITLLAIGPDPVGVNLRMVKELGVPYKMLSDEGQRTAMAYGVQMDDDFSRKILKEGVPLPASFLVDKQGVVRYTSRPEKAGEFLDPATIFPALQGLAA